jgi:cytochrome b561
MGKPTHRRYTPTARTLHWLIALLIVVQFVLARVAAHLPLGVRKLSILAEHKSVGMTVLILALIRVAWRVKHTPPPLSGWLMSSAKNYSVSWFGVFSWPNLIAPNEAAFDSLRALHHLLSKVLIAIASLHILAAFKHHFWNKDDVLVRMLPAFRPENKS